MNYELFVYCRVEGDMALFGCLLPNGDTDIFSMSRLCSLLEFAMGEIGATDLEVVPNACLFFTTLEYLVLRNID